MHQIIFMTLFQIEQAKDVQSASRTSDVKVSFVVKENREVCCEGKVAIQKHS